MEFKIGERVVHPKYGVGIVVNLEEREFEPGVMHRYYEISMPGTTLWVSLEMPTFGLRKLTVRSEIARCRIILASHPAPFIENARERQAEMADQLKLGTIAAHCEVVRDLYAYLGDKPHGDRIGGFLRVVQDVLGQEWALVEDVTLLDAAEEIKILLEKGREAIDQERA
jgi:Transcriptional regulators, similar to M. xanthus CarD